ncbi:NLR family CARD domain-containing protein 3-like isoform 2-T2 [Menidia menidia]
MEGAASGRLSPKGDPSQPATLRGPPHPEPRAEYPEPDCLSLKSHISKIEPPDLRDGPGPSDTDSRAEYPEPDCRSVKSHISKIEPPDLRDGPGPSDTEGERSGFCEEQLSSCALCRGVLKDPVSFSPGHWFCRHCSSSYWDQAGSPGDPLHPQCGERTRAGPQTDSQSRAAADAGLQQLLEEHQISLRSRCERVTEGTDATGSGTLLNQIYTELYITEGPSEEVQTQHEVRQLEASRSLQDAPIRCHDIFRASAEQPGAIRVVLTSGVAGVGKTFSVLKFTLDWAQGLENQDVGLVALLSFRELNLLRGGRLSLLGLLAAFHPTLQALGAEQLAACRLVLIFDGLDESRLDLDFSSSPVLTDPTQSSPLSWLLASLIRGDLLPSALVWITSRPAAANRIPPAWVDRLTEVRGFSDPQKEEYFSRRFRDQELSSRMVSHIRSSRSLHTMCAVPVFCWISASVLEHLLGSRQTEELPSTMTQLYAHFLLVQTHRKRNKYPDAQQASPGQLAPADRDLLLRLGRLAFQHLETGSIMFYQDDLERCGLEVSEALLYSGVCTEIFRKENVIFQRAIYSFVHLSVQEFLAALYLLHCYSQRDLEGLRRFLGDDYSYSSLDDFLKRAMVKSCESPNGHLDLLVRFLHGLSLDSNQRLLAGLLGPNHSSPETIQRIKNNLKEISVYDISPDRSINVFHCLMEIRDLSVFQEIQEFLKSKNRSEKKLSEMQCSALAFMLQMSDEVLDELDLEHYNTTKEGKHRLIPAVRNCKKARLAGCELSEHHCEVVASALKSNPSHLIDLDLSQNVLEDSGVEHVSAGLENPNCKLEILRMRGCRMSEIGSAAVVSALKSNPSHLTELNLTWNDLSDCVMKELSSFLQSPLCGLKNLRLNGCRLSEVGFAALISALKFNPSLLKKLDLTGNIITESMVKELSSFLQSPAGGLKALRMEKCNLSEVSCACLASALKSNPSHLTELDLSWNHLTDAGVKELSSFLQSPLCGLETLRLKNCSLSEVSCAALASALRSNPSHLTELDLTWNDLKQSDIQQLLDLKQNPHYKLKTLRWKW